MKVTVHDGWRKAVLSFEPPEREKWSKQNSDFLIGYPTGLREPFSKVFIKCVQGAPQAHHLLVNLVGHGVRGTPKVYGHAQEGREYFYFFQNLPTDYCLLEEEIKRRGVRLIRQQLIRAVVKQAVETFKAMGQYGYVYIDFCARNIMLHYRSRRIVIIDIDSAWPVMLLEKKGRPDHRVQVEFWGLWNEEICKVVPINVNNAPKTVVVSFAGVWSRALMWVKRKTQSDERAAINLVLNPSSDYQRPLWKALKEENRQEFIEYFQLRGTQGEAIYMQWQFMFDGLRSRRELPWQDVISATDNLLSAIEGDGKPRGKPSQQPSPVGTQARQPVSHSKTVAGPMPRYGQAQPTGPPVPGVGVPKSFFVRYRTGLVLASGLVAALIAWGAVQERSPDSVPIGASERCIITAGSASGQTTGTLYYEKTANRARADFYTKNGGIKQGDHFIMYPGMMYAWQDDGKVGIAVDLIGDADPKKMFNSSTEVKCDSWVPTNTPFILPDGIMYRHVSKEEAVQYFESRNLIKE